eukprot:465869-Amphidinium_carterae.1
MGQFALVWPVDIAQPGQPSSSNAASADHCRGRKTTRIQDQFAYEIYRFETGLPKNLLLGSYGFEEEQECTARCPKPPQS